MEAAPEYGLAQHKGARGFGTGEKYIMDFH